MISRWNNLSDTVGSLPGTGKFFISINCFLLGLLKARSYKGIEICLNHFPKEIQEKGKETNSIVRMMSLLKCSGCSL